MSAMSDLKAKWAQLGARFDAFSQRERGLIAGAVIGGVVMIGFSLLIDPNLARARSVQKQVEQARGDLATVQAQLQLAQGRLQLDPDAAKRSEVSALRQTLATVESSLKKLENGLVAPEQMNVVLERLLARHSSIKLLSFKSVLPINLAEAVAEDSAAADGPKIPAAGQMAGLYKHGVELKLEGSYADLHAWLAQLEAAPQKVLWGDVRFSVVEHPRAVLSVTIYTLSLDKSWLAI